MNSFESRTSNSKLLLPEEKGVRFIFDANIGKAAVCKLPFAYKGDGVLFILKQV